MSARSTVGIRAFERINDWRRKETADLVRSQCRDKPIQILRRQAWTRGVVHQKRIARTASIVQRFQSCKTDSFVLPPMVVRMRAS